MLQLKSLVINYACVVGEWLGKGRPGGAKREGLGECHSVSNLDLGCISLRKSKIGFLNPKESENGFWVSLLNRSIQDLSDHGVKGIHSKWIFQFF